MKVTVTGIGFKELQRDLKKMSEEKAIRFKKETYASGLDIQKKAKENLKESKSWDLGNLANSIMVDRIEGGMAAEIGPVAPHGPYVEYGTKPHFPPYKGPDAEGLEGWAKRHGFDSVWPICLVIAERGLPAKPYLLPAYLTVVDKYFNRVKGILRK